MLDWSWKPAFTSNKKKGWPWNQAPWSLDTRGRRNFVLSWLTKLHFESDIFERVPRPHELKSKTDDHCTQLKRDKLETKLLQVRQCWNSLTWTYWTSLPFSSLPFTSLTFTYLHYTYLHLPNFTSEPFEMCMWPHMKSTLSLCLRVFSIKKHSIECVVYCSKQMRETVVIS